MSVVTARTRGGAAAGLAVAVLAACSLDSPPTSTSGDRVEAVGVEALVPEGWTSDVVGGTLVIALRGRDLDAEVPAGPRVVIARGGELPDPEALFADVENAPGPLTGDPKQVEVGGEPAIEIGEIATHRRVDVEARVIAAVSPHGEPYLVRLEAPDDEWDLNQDDLDVIVASIEFVAAPGG